MKQHIEIQNAIEVMDKLFNSKRVEGVLFLDPVTRALTFKAYNRKPYQRKKDTLVAKLPWGWVKDSARRNKRFTSVPKDLSLDEKLCILDQENTLAKRALVRQVLFGPSTGSGTYENQND